MIRRIVGWANRIEQRSLVQRSDFYRDALGLPFTLAGAPPILVEASD
ncbi:MAG: hypothetical protein AAGJ81_08045 [Verrucomicrobiota bacterium]